MIAQNYEYVEAIKCMNNDHNHMHPNKHHYEPGMIDLGLPSGTLWSLTNLGATCGDDPDSWYGGYYSWGELETKNLYLWALYKYGDGTNFTKYNQTDLLTELELEDDAIAVNNYSWTLPTVEQVKELFDNTEIRDVYDYNGISGLNGFTYTSLKNSSKHIFLPNGGYNEGYRVLWKGDWGYYWTKSLMNNMYSHAHNLAADVIQDGPRSCGMNLRGVKNFK